MSMDVGLFLRLSASFQQLLDLHESHQFAHESPSEVQKDLDSEAMLWLAAAVAAPLYSPQFLTWRDSFQGFFKGLLKPFVMILDGLQAAFQHFGPGFRPARLLLRFFAADAGAFESSA